MNKKLILFVGISLLILIGIFVIFNSKNFSSYILGNQNLEFYSSPCNSSFAFEKSNLDIQEVRWLDNNKLQIKANVVINCAEKIEKGKYEIQGNEIILKYYSPMCGSSSNSCAKCMCLHEITYKIKNLDKKDYQFRLKRIS